MSPRSYRLGRRAQTVTATRLKILSAARGILVRGPSGGFNIDAIARKAGVTRATVYAQFGSKARLLEALFDDLAARGRMHTMSSAFHEPDPQRALDLFWETLLGFWTAERRALRRIRALGRLDVEVGRALSVRDGWRRQGIRSIVERLSGARPGVRPGGDADAVERLYALTSFEVYDLLAGASSDARRVDRLLRPLIAAAIEISAPWPSASRQRS